LRRDGSRTRVWGAEPLLGNDAARSLRAGRIVVNETEPVTIADGARTISLGKLNWEIIKDEVEGIIEIPEATIEEAVRIYFGLANLKCEPTGALSLGAVVLEKNRFKGQKVCLVVSGGNVDPAVYRELLAG
jgi:threonine dehydratase